MKDYISRLNRKLYDFGYDVKTDLYKLRHNKNIKAYSVIAGMVGIVAGSLLLNRVQLLEKKAAATNVQLSFPASFSSVLGGTITVPVMLNTDNHVVDSVDLKIQYDPNYLQLVSITGRTDTSNLKTFLPQVNGVFDSQGIVTRANSSGILDFGAVALSSTGPTTGFSGALGPTNPLATLTFKTLRSTGSTPIIFIYNGAAVTTDSNVNGLVEGADILGITQNAIVSINNPTPTPAPATSTPTPKPTLTPTPSVDTTKPSVSILKPLNGSSVTVNTDVVIKADATDNVGVAKVQYYVNGTWVGVENYAPYDFTWHVPSGAGITYTLMARALDAAGNASSASVSVKSVR